MMVFDTSTLSKPQRLCLGVFVLLALAIIWSASAELTEYIFKDENFKKPFFTSYLKNSLFILYLLGFLCHPQWQQQCYRTTQHPVNHNDDHHPSQYSDAFVGEPNYQPLNYNSDSEKSSVSGGDDGDIQIGRGVNSDVESSINRSVRFNRVAEVRHLSDNHAQEASLARMSYHASLRAQQVAAQIANKWPVRYVAKLALIFCFLWFGGQLSYQEALSDSHSGVVQVLSSTSSLFTLILASLFPSSPQDRFTLSKLLAVLLSCGGVVLVTLSDEHLEHSSLPDGALWALCGALLYAMYLVFLRRHAGDDTKLDIPMFFGFVGLFNLLLLWPGFLLLHWTHLEVFEWPDRHQMAYLLLNGLVGTVIAELLWLWGCFLTSSLIATLSLSLTIPLTMLADVLLKKVDYSWMFYGGMLPIALSFLATALFTHWDEWDPALVIVKRILHFICKVSRCCRRVSRDESSVDREQRESLIGVNGDVAGAHLA